MLYEVITCVIFEETTKQKAKGEADKMHFKLLLSNQKSGFEDDHTWSDIICLTK